MRRRFAIGTWVFFRLLAVIHLIAFGSFLHQWRGLVGPAGILPAVRLFSAAVKAQVGVSVYWRLPSVFWWTGAGAIPWFAALGIVLAVLLFAGIAPGPCLVLLWADYLSLMAAGQVFYDFQWDALLLETTLMAIFAAPWSLRPGWRLREPPWLARWLLWWLLFRLMVLSGTVKLTSGDTSWQHLTALYVHFQTQPLPTPLAWYADHLPHWLLSAACAIMFAIELVAPFGLWAGAAARRGAALAILFLQVIIELTGNYTFFNLLTAALCLIALDDAFWVGLVRKARWRARLAAAASEAVRPRAGPARMALATVVVAVTGLISLSDYSAAVAGASVTRLAIGLTAPFRSLNGYGLFAEMTPDRPELIFEGSDDGHDWRPYVFPHKPGPLDRRPDYVAPGQPRLDWQLWFAALEPPEGSPWIAGLVAGLLRGDPSILALIARNPFPDHPPKYLRIVRYIYSFTTPAERRATGNWWNQVFDEMYLGPVTLGP